jgi:hypothetical protein
MVSHPIKAEFTWDLFPAGSHHVHLGQSKYLISICWITTTTK